MSDRDDALRKELGWTGPEETNYEPPSAEPTTTPSATPVPTRPPVDYPLPAAPTEPLPEPESAREPVPPQRHLSSHHPRPRRRASPSGRVRVSVRPRSTPATRGRSPRWAVPVSHPSSGHRSRRTLRRGGSRVDRPGPCHRRPTRDRRRLSRVSTGAGRGSRTVPIRASRRRHRRVATPTASGPATWYPPAGSSRVAGGVARCTE